MHDVERIIGAIAGPQDNIVTRAELLAAGVGRGAISHRLKTGAMHSRHRGVYLVGHAPPTPVGKARAAALACGEDAVASHRSAAEVWRLLAPADNDADITVVGHGAHPHAGIKIHRVRSIHRSELRDFRGLPVTSPARTICDLAATEPLNEVEYALQEARVRRMVSDSELLAVIARAPTRKGGKTIRRLLATDIDGYTRSKAERLMRSLLHAAALSQPQANAYLHGHLVDFVWPEQRLVVEIDGYGTHGDRTAFERDRLRDQMLVAAGYRVVRITWRQLNEEPYGVIARLAQALAVARAA
jgi:very-short-patch-repair endonuclease